MTEQQVLLDRFEYRDGHLYWKQINPKFKRRKVGDRVGSMHKTGYWCTNYNGTTVKIHRIIFLMHHGFLPEEVDHINGDRADNRIENLRAANRSENQCNRPSLANNTSGYPGVSWHKKSKAWTVRVMKNGKQNLIGYFKDLELAGLVAVEARAKYHGQFARV